VVTNNNTYQYPLLDVAGGNAFTFSLAGDAGLLGELTGALTLFFAGANAFLGPLPATFLGPITVTLTGLMPDCVAGLDCDLF